MRSVKARTVTSYVLYKQHLLETAQAEQVLPVVEDLLALHATSPITPYLSLFARMKKLQRQSLDEALYVNRELIRLELMRGTLFLTSTTLAPILFQATRLSTEKFTKWLQSWGMPNSEYQKLCEYLFSLLRDGGKTLNEIKQAIPSGMVRTVERTEGQAVNRMTNVNLVLSALMRQGRIFSEKFRDPILATQINRYAFVEHLYPSLNLEQVSQEDAKPLLVKLYLRAFGPVTEQDIVWWTGFSITDTREALKAVELEVCPIRIKGFPDDYLMLETDYARLRKFKAPRRSGAFLLPYEDPFIKGYKIRNRLIDTENESRVYIGGIAAPTIVVNGKIVGVWNRAFEDRKDTISLRLFQRIKRGEKKVLKQKTQAIMRLMTGRDDKMKIEMR